MYYSHGDYNRPIIVRHMPVYDAKVMAIEKMVMAVFVTVHVLPLIAIVLNYLL